MNKRFKHYLLLFFIVSILFFVYVTKRSIATPFIGADSYYFLNYIFHSIPLFLTNSVGTFIFSLLPKSIFGIKIIMLIITLVTLFIAYEIGRLYSKEHSLIYPFSLISMFTFSLIFFKLEDDLFSLPFLFLSLYFIIRFQVSKTKKEFLDINIILSLLFLFISTMIWGYSVFFILMFLFLTNFHRLYILASTIFIIFLNKTIGLIIPNQAIAENQTAFLSMNIAGGIILLLFFLYLKKSMIQKNKLGIYVFSVLTLLNFKFIYILFPILLLNNIKLIKSLHNKSKYIIYFIYLLFLIGTLHQIITLPPSNKDYELVNVAQTYKIKLNKEIIYPWGLGYFLMYHNIPVSNFGTPPKQKINYKNKIVMTIKNNQQLKNYNCRLLRSGKFYELLSCS